MKKFKTRDFNEEIVERTYSEFKEGVLNVINEYNFKQFMIAIKSAGFISARLVNSNMALDFAAKRLLDKLPAGLVEEFSGGRAVLNLDAVPQLKTFFSRMEIKQWAFYTTSINVEAELK